ncbi:MAG: MBL fold metallo-hydrolase [Dehalococcoidia bacterium]|nr:MBL fold metallo-hydrolase [Dehalococcoidia bacterium]
MDVEQLVRIKFWGTRGSIPTPGLSTLRYGGNTSCVEIRTSDNTLIILDAGSGIRELGRSLLSSSKGSIEGHILISHTHWDHIQGFPFFIPAFIPGNQFTFYGFRNFEKSLEGALAGQMDHVYFPVRLDQLAAEIHFKEFDKDILTIGSARVSYYLMNHPAVCLAYRVDCDGTSVVYATDSEPVADDLDGEHEQGFIMFAKGAYLLIHDAMYSHDEYQKKRGWGHSYPEYAIRLAQAAGINRLALFHHDPEHDDNTIRSFEEFSRAYVRISESSLDVFCAEEGAEIAL